MPRSLVLQIVGRCSLVSAAFFLHIAATNGQTKQDDINLEKAIERARWWRSQLANVRLSCEVRCSAAIREGLPNLTDEEVSGWFRKEEWIWSDVGLLWHEHTRYRFHKPYDAQQWGENSATGECFEAWFAYRNDRKVLTEIKIRFGSSNVNSMPLNGLFRGGLRTGWLDEVLPKDYVSVVGVSDVNETRCLHILLGGADVWLDPTHDYLPRRVLFNKGKEYESEFVVEEYQEVDHGLWFPQRGHFRGLSSRLAPDVWTITQLELNRELDRSVFRFPAAELGTLVHNQITDEYYRHGDTSLARERELAASARQKLPRVTPTTTGPAESPTVWMRWAAVGPLLLAILTHVLTDAIRKRSRPSGREPNFTSPSEVHNAHD